jgi:methylase of polypeptide subunit release factors
MDSRVTDLSPAETGGLGAIRLHHPPGTFSPTPATRITLLAVAQHRNELVGSGVDWGCGVGVLSIAAARLEGVRRIVGLDLSRGNVTAARENAVANGVEDRVVFTVSDSFDPVDADGRSLLGPLRGRLDFLVANPPHSTTNDGFDFRRRVLGGGAEYLRPEGLALVQALSAYGAGRVEELAGHEYRYEGVALSTDLVPLDFGRQQLQRQLAVYIAEERRGGRAYEFFSADTATRPLTAVDTQRALRAGETIFGRWQVHRFRRLA